ncbi:MAG: hypothetical protein ACE5IJ_10890, partial [Thermoplasmata archaeon]
MGQREKVPLRKGVGHAPRAIIVLGIFCLMTAAFAFALLPRASAVEVLEQRVLFGIPRTKVVDNLDFEATCFVEVSYALIEVADGGEASGFISPKPG